LAVLSGAAVVIVGISWLAIQNRHLRTELSKVQAKEVQLRQSEEKLRQQFADMQGGQSTSNNEEAMQVAELDKGQWPEVSLRLVPRSVRSAGNAVVLHLPSAKSWIRLEMEMETGDKYPNYEVVLQTAEGQEVYRRTIPGSTSRNQEIVLRLRSSLIHPGDYVVRVSGKAITDARTEEIEAYTFRVVQP